MKNYILIITLFYSLSSFGQSPEPVPVTTQSISITGALTAGLWISDHNNKPYPDYPKMYYGFAEGDEIVLDFSTENRKGTQIIEVSEFESKSVVYSNHAFQTLEGIRIKVPKTAVYKFEFATNHIIDRQANVTIKRIPASEATRNFNCNVIWKTLNDTTFTVAQQKRRTGISYEAVTLQSPMGFFVNSGSNATFLGGKSRILIPVNLPAGTVEWYYTFGALRNKEDIEGTKERMKLFSELAGLLDRSGIMSLGVEALTRPPATDYCDVYLLTPEHAQAFINKQDGQWQGLMEGSRPNLESGVVKVKNAYGNNPLYLGFRNPSGSYGLTVLVEIVAIVGRERYETVSVRQPVSYVTRKMPVFGN